MLRSHILLNLTLSSIYIKKKLISIVILIVKVPITNHCINPTFSNKKTLKLNLKVINIILWISIIQVLLKYIKI